MTGLSKNEIFIQNSNEKFNNRFEFFNNYNSVIDIIDVKCKEHNIIFKTTPVRHLKNINGSCPECTNNNNKNIRRLDKTYFIEKSKKMFENIYDYSKVNYINKKEKIILICKKHNNEFSIEPKSHYYSVVGGCNMCSHENNIVKNINKIKTIKQKIEKICENCNNIIKNNICKKCIKIKKTKNIRYR